MPSDNYHSLCKRLADINNRIFLDLDTSDAAALSQLTAELKRVMQDLTHAGECRDTGMLGVFKELRDQVLGLAQKIQEQRDELCKQLLMAERKKQAVAVYTHDTRGPRSNMRPLYANRGFNPR